MGLRKILTYKDPALHKVCRPVEKFDWRLHKLLNDMADTLAEANGVGLAAPQVGVLKQIVVIDCNWGDTGEKDPIYLINPYIVEQSEEKAPGMEGCLSIPGIAVEIERSTSVTVRALNLEGQLMQYKAANNLFCVCLQHEIDHLHGYTMFERLEPAERMRAIAEYQEALANGARPGDTE